MASHRPRRVGGTHITLARGELVTSVRTLAKRWVWSKSRVHRFLGELDHEDMLKAAAGTASGTVYRVVSYDTYAPAWDSTRDTGGTLVGQEQELKETTTPLIVPPKRDRKTRLPESWHPTDQHRERASTEGVDCDREAEKFRAHHEAKGTVMLSWDKAFTTWLLKAPEFGGRTNGNVAAKTVPIEGSAARFVP